MSMEIRKVQLLLMFLGFPVGTADGLAGERTNQAVRDFQGEFGGLEADGLVGPQTEAALRRAVGQGWERPSGGGFWGEVPHFRREEFRCRCGGKACNGFPAEPEEGLVRLAETVRGHFGVPVILSSGVRCPAHNRAVGGVANSRHLQGKAMDFSVKGVPAGTVVKYVQGLQGVRYTYAIDGSFVHMDVD